MNFCSKHINDTIVNVHRSVMINMYYWLNCMYWYLNLINKHKSISYN